MTLVEFLLARIAEDEAAARQVEGASGGAWAALPVGLLGLARWHPARVLAECEAKRRIVAEVVPRIDGLQDAVDREWGANDDHVTLGLLRLLALPYADHPDFRPEWRP